MKKEITIKELATEWVSRIDGAKGIDCCKEEIKMLAKLAGERLPDEKVTVNWTEH